MAQCRSALVVTELWVPRRILRCRLLDGNCPECSEKPSTRRNLAGMSEKQLGSLIETKNVFNFHQAQGSNGKIAR